MTADEIRNWPITDRGLAFNEPHRVAIDQAEFLRELAAQIAELNEARKPRWVNLSDDEPCLVDATRVIGLSCGMRDGRKCVIVRLRDTPEPFTVFDSDHDEVRFLLGIDEDWLQPPRYALSRHISEADYAEMTAIIDTARKLVNNRSLVETTAGTSREDFDKLDQLFDSFDSLPF